MNDEGKLRVVKKVRDILGEAEPTDEECATKTGRSVTINGGSSNRIVGGNFYDQSIRIEKIAPPNVIVKTGDGVLTAQQKAKIHTLVDSVVQASATKRTPLTHKVVWKQLDIHMSVNKYDEILKEDFDGACKYLKKREAIFLGMVSAPKKNPAWRSKRIAAIHARCKQRGWEEWRIKYMKEKFNEVSMINLCDADLELLYRSVMSKR